MVVVAIEKNEVCTQHLKEESGDEVATAKGRISVQIMENKYNKLSGELILVLVMVQKSAKLNS